MSSYYRSDLGQKLTSDTMFLSSHTIYESRQLIFMHRNLQ